ncbi:MAG: DNA repair protein [Hyphomicrobiales bacterium]|nr:DNA repair protein [Hyphomicrobiales bacterium]MBV8827435.1 DNA repair protein [Hyphomicrobiales bacterium]MBV9426770.1 DNA repair protein [Bradyrhizobiaceae bacterium]
MVVVRFSTSSAVSAQPREAGREVLCALKHSLRAFEPDLDYGVIPVGIGAIDQVLGGGLARAALHEVAAAGESAITAATQFVLGLAAHSEEQRAVLWIVEDMALLENGAPYGPGLDDVGIHPERLVTVAGAKSRDVLWAMEEALRCRAVGVVIGEVRSVERLDLVASRRLSLAAGQRDVCAFLLRTLPGTDASAAATRWMVAAAPSRASPAGPGPPRFSVHLTRNRRGPVGSWLVEWHRAERRFDLAPPVSEPVADAACDRPHRAAAHGA